MSVFYPPSSQTDSVATSGSASETSKQLASSEREEVRVTVQQGADAGCLITCYSGLSNVLVVLFACLRMLSGCRNDSGGGNNADKR